MVFDEASRGYVVEKVCGLLGSSSHASQERLGRFSLLTVYGMCLDDASLRSVLEKATSIEFKL